MTIEHCYMCGDLISKNYFEDNYYLFKSDNCLVFSGYLCEDCIKKIQEFIEGEEEKNG